MASRLINRSQQGDLGEASAIEWLTRVGATVSLPVGHSPDYDLVAELDGDLVRVQVKTSVVEVRTQRGRAQHNVRVATSGGNQSWTRIVKRFDPARVDYVFILTGDGRRWLIPSEAIEATTALCLGGVKYSEYEIEPAAPITPLVYGEASALESPARPGEYPSGQRTAAVNRQAQPSQVRILSPPSSSPRAYGERRLGRSGQAIVRGKRQMTVPHKPFTEAGLNIGDRIRFRADGPGRVVMERIEAPG